MRKIRQRGQSFTNTKVNPLKMISMKKACERSYQFIKSCKDGDIRPMRTRWKGVNGLLGGGYWFGGIHFIGGGSGVGKSYYMNMLYQDFTNKKLNPIEDLAVLHFNWEMSSAKEIARTATSKLNISYSQLVSATEELNEKDFKKFKEFLVQHSKNDTFTFCEETGNRFQIEATISLFRETYPDSHIVIGLDHTLLVEEISGENEVFTLAKLAKALMRFVKNDDKMMFILLGQLNDRIESDKRRDEDNPSLHFPIKTDVFGSKQIYHACETVQILHSPEFLGINEYGPSKFPTKDLVAVHCLKNRNGDMSGNRLSRLRKNFKVGSLDPWI